MTRDEIVVQIRNNINDAGAGTFYTAADLVDSFQDAYDDIAVISGCIQKSVTLDWVDDLSYYNFLSTVPDYFAVVAIYNNNTNRWLTPTAPKDLDNVRIDWELWEGQPAFFAPINFKYVAIAPKMLVATGNFTLVYRAMAPTVTLGSTVPLVHLDEQTRLFQSYPTADLLDQQEKYKASEVWWKQYFEDVKRYKARVARLAVSDYAPGV